MRIQHADRDHIARNTIPDYWAYVLALKSSCPIYLTLTINVHLGKIKGNFVHSL